MNDLIQIIAFSIIVILTLTILAIIIITRGRPSSLDQQKYRAEWLKIENGLDKNNAATYKFALLTIDKMLNDVLDELKIDGEDVAEKLKKAKDISSVKTILAATKWREQIADKPDEKIDIAVVKRAISAYKKSLRDLGAI
ncbi:hypothetical protein FWF74_03875 [Candidatus Saccharibacteria bacterium]|nr:hypothetical protein [Candidatus Saccharibacteria bacterium]MCL1963002.1 hypothetical protein [Candidatus Saccharibacteria bacterium]